MKYFCIILWIGLWINTISAQQAQPPKPTNAQLALVYYNARDFEKAVPLLLETYKNSKNNYYFRLYLNALLELKRFDEAGDEISKEINKQRVPNSELLVNLGRVYEAQGKAEEAKAKYLEAIDVIPPNKGNYTITANSFIQWGKYEYAEKTYLKGRELFPEEQFYYELARVYLYLRNYEQMMEEYLNMLRQNEKQLSRVQNSLSSAMQLDIDDGLRDQFRGQVLKRIQSEPDIIGYNRLLIWFFLQEKKFSSAMRQSIALDKRTGEEDAQIAQLGQMALNNKNYTDAGNAYAYLLEKGEGNQYYKLAFAQNLHVLYQQFVNETPGDTEKGAALSEQFGKGLEYLGYQPATLQLIQDYAHLLAFYLGDPENSIAVLKRGLEFPQLKPEETGLLKTEMADVYIYAGDPWEATLIYSQVIDANKNNTLGDEVKLKKARLGYYLGNFSWAKAQLDVLKASTSKLTANDAMELSLLIGNNLNLDTTALPLQMFALADLLFFRSQDSAAMAILDSIAVRFPYHTLVDDILYRKSKIAGEQQNYTQAAACLEQIVTDFSYESLADDALFELAELRNYKLGEKEKAMELYKQMIFNFPGSIYVDESRTKYRELRETFPDNGLQPAENQPRLPENEIQ
jgi:tetratricopeptide (TPR) repeat protein